jgi:DNA (cytosine-5)-methyltransferase 1
MIHNHYSARLSELDLQIARSVPPGGNWKNIPTTVPSKRLEQIRLSYAQGKGSRSTYYGRLRPDAPSYTINTYFQRPGNGCHLHYDFQGEQHRVISQREAARFQSFPDSFIFLGSNTSIYKQIGNAVPPLLAFQIAQSIGEPGLFIDLFAGAGGLALGFVWAGWQSVIANDIEAAALETYARNIHDNIVVGDIRDPKIFDTIVSTAHRARAMHPNLRLFILGGPPCQGFSTAGKVRSMDDERNSLFNNYRDVVKAIQPDGFVFENVMGLLNMEGGKVFEQVQTALHSVTNHLSVWKLNAEQYGVPQRRKRVILVGQQNHHEPLLTPLPLCNLENTQIQPITAYEAISDLPRLEPGQDGSSFEYISPAVGSFQQLVREIITPAEYVATLQLRAFNLD